MPGRRTGLRPGVLLSREGPVTAVYRDAQHVDVFFTDSGGTVLTIARDGNGPWPYQWGGVGYPDPPATINGGVVTAVYRDPTHLDVFMAGKDGTIWTTECSNGDWPSSGTQLGPPSIGTAGEQVTAIFRDASHLDVFAAGVDGTCKLITQTEGTWPQQWTDITAGTKTAPGGPITALYRDPTHFDLFMAGTDGKCWTIGWEDGAFDPAWTAVQPSYKTKKDAPIAGIYRDPTQIDLFMSSGTDGSCLATNSRGSVLPTSAVKHVFVLMLENRSFDHMLGWSAITGTDAVTKTPTSVCGLTSADTNTYNGVSYSAGNTAPDSMPVDPGHEFSPDVMVQLAGEGASYPRGGPYPQINMSGFVANYVDQPDYNQDGGNQPAMSMNCFTPNTLPILSALAQEFAVCDHWYSSVPGATWPNRFFVHAASSGGLDHSPEWDELVEAYTWWGYEFNHGTVYDRLDNAYIPWRIYRQEHSLPQALGMDGMHYWTFYEYEDFRDDVNDPNYPAAYTFIEPDYGRVSPPWSDYIGGNSQHPLDKVSSGEDLIKQTYETLRASPIWDSSVLIITYDEHGGFYDHVAPPSAPPPNDGPQTSSSNNKFGFPFDQYGVRVPTVIISPLIAQNLIDHTPYDHTSILSTLEALFVFSPLTDRDGAASNFVHLFSPPPARTNTPKTLLSVYPPSEAELPGRASSDGVATDQSRELRGDEPGFLHVALRADLDVSRSDERGVAVAAVPRGPDASRCTGVRERSGGEAQVVGKEAHCRYCTVTHALVGPPICRSKAALLGAERYQPSRSGTGIPVASSMSAKSWHSCACP